MGDILRGNTPVSKIYRGQTELSKVYRGQTEVWSATPPGPISRTPLTAQELTNAAAVYSFNLLNSSYVGDCVEVRRTGDNVSANIGFDVNGNLDETALLSHVGGNDGFIRTWYTQIGTANMQETTNAGMAKIVDAGTVIKVNGKIAPQFTDLAFTYVPTTSLSISNTLSLAIVSTKPTQNQRYIYSTNAAAAAPAIIFGYNPGSGIVDVEWFASTERFTISASGMSTTALSQYSVTRNASTVTAYFNGVEAFSNATNYNASTTFRLIGGTANDGFPGNIAEFIYWQADKASDIGGINSNQTNWFGV